MIDLALSQHQISSDTRSHSNATSYFNPQLDFLAVSLGSELFGTESFDVDVSCFQKTLNQSEDGTSTGAIRDIGQPRPVYLSNNLFSDKKRQFPIKCKIEHWRSNGGRSVKCLLVRKARRCKFCRSKAKYLPGQRSLDTVSAKLFRRKKSPEPVRRAASEDRWEKKNKWNVLCFLASLFI